MLTIRQDQLQVLRDIMLKQFEDRMVAHLNSTLPEKAGKLAGIDLRQIIQLGIKSAARYKIEVEIDVQRYLELMFELGPDFDRNAQTAWTQKHLSREDLWAWEKLDEIENQAALLSRERSNAHGP